MPIIRNVGNSARDIKDYIPRLQRNVFPQLKQYGIAMLDLLHKIRYLFHIMEKPMTESN